MKYVVDKFLLITLCQWVAHIPSGHEIIQTYNTHTERHIDLGLYKFVKTITFRIQKFWNNLHKKILFDKSLHSFWLQGTIRSVVFHNFCNYHKREFGLYVFKWDCIKGKESITYLFWIKSLGHFLCRFHTKSTVYASPVKEGSLLGRNTPVSLTRRMPSEHCLFPPVKEVSGNNSILVFNVNAKKTHLVCIRRQHVRERSGCSLEVRWWINRKQLNRFWQAEVLYKILTSNDTIVDPFCAFRCLNWSQTMMITIFFIRFSTVEFPNSYTLHLAKVSSPPHFTRLRLKILQ